MSEEWYARPVLFVADVDRTLDFYVNRLGFTQSWRFEENGKAFVAEAGRQGCTLIFSSQWPAKIGKALMFISHDVEGATDADVDAVLDKVRAEFVGKGVKVEDGWWGYKVLIVRDPDGNELYFNYPTAGDAPPAKT